MYEFRWMIEKWIEYDDCGYPVSRIEEEPVLQYRTMSCQTIDSKTGVTTPVWSEWKAVETVYIES